MKHVRPILIAAAALTLVISACSQPDNANSHTLQPQFGTSDDDLGRSVTLDASGGAYILSEQNGRGSDYNEIVLHHYSNNGTQLWTKVIATLETEIAGPWLNAEKIERGVQGNVYVLHSRGYIYGDFANYTYYMISIYDANGQFKRSFSVGQSLTGWSEEDLEIVADMALDTAGNTYVAIQQATVDFYHPPDFTTADVVRKYGPTGSLIWERPSIVGVSTGVAVSSDGSVYVSGRSGLARYNSSGTLFWKKPGFYNGVAASGSRVFAHNKNTVYRFSSAGQQQGSSFMGGLNSVNIQELSGNGAGGVLVSGMYAAGTDNWNAFVRKLSATGSSQWTSTFGTPSYDDAEGVVAVNGREAYVTGTTRGSLAHPNRGENDGYVRKLGIGGKPIWTR